MNPNITLKAKLYATAWDILGLVLAAATFIYVSDSYGVGAGICAFIAIVLVLVAIDILISRINGYFRAVREMRTLAGYAGETENEEDK